MRIRKQRTTRDLRPHTIESTLLSQRAPLKYPDGTPVPPAEAERMLSDFAERMRAFAARNPVLVYPEDIEQAKTGLIEIVKELD